MLNRAFSDLEEDLAYGLDVIVKAKWALVVAVLLLMLWAPGPIGQLRVQILAWLLVAVQTFYLHAQLLKRKRVPEALVYAASAVDLIVVSALILLQGGFDSNLYIFYFPAIVAFSVAFRPETTVVFAFATLLSYACICLGDFGSEGVTDHDLQTLLTRLIALAAVAFCGALYWKIEQDRRVASGKWQVASGK
jgi:hypothetical protein